MKNNKTNVMRVLEQHKIDYATYSYGDGVTAASGTEVAELLGKDPLNVFKTLVTIGKTGQHYVFVVPCFCCSPIGMKKFFPTVVDISARECPKMLFSGGHIGYQVEVSPSDLEKVIPLKYADIVE